MFMLKFVSNEAVEAVLCEMSQGALNLGFFGHYLKFLSPENKI